MIDYGEYILSKKERLRFLVIYGCCLWFLSTLFYHHIWLCFLFPLTAYPGLKHYSSYLGEKRNQQLSLQFRDTLYALSASIATGRQLSEALVDARENMKTIYGDQAIIVRELSFMVKRIFDSRETEEVVLRDFARRSAHEDIASFVDIYFTCRATGGDLVKVMTKTSGIIMDKMAIDKEIKMLTAQKRFEAKLLTAMPIVLLLFLQIASSDYIAVLYTDMRGRLLMTIAMAGMGLAYLWSMRLMKIQL